MALPWLLVILRDTQPVLGQPCRPPASIASYRALVRNLYPYLQSLTRRQRHEFYMPNPTNAPQYVSFGPRFGAFIIDSIVVLPLLIAAIITAYRHLDSGFAMLLAGGDNIWINYGIPAGFTLLFWLIKAATPGKLMLRTMIVDADTLTKPAPWQLLVRYFGYYLSLLPLGLGFLWILWDPRKQGWHDKLARTVVIVRRTGGV